MDEALEHFDVFLSHSHVDAVWVEQLARRLEDERGLKVWLDRWVLVPGKPWQRKLATALDEVAACAVCIGHDTPTGWCQEEMEKAVDRQTADADFRVIPVLLPDASADFVPGFLPMRTWADFRNRKDEAYAFHVLVQRILGEPIGRWPPVVKAIADDNGPSDTLQVFERKVVELQRLRGLGLHDEVVVEFERKLLQKWLDD